ncbi:exosome complex component RRP45 isoform X2 [Pteropus alecto]|uniref:exosome complex component RRP45 isoform X2 n=1 Tax=Pteropus alecto TaxID=9402 RepID=UPI000D5365CB|nr:exosome complex component RRP45 isoform X2 [Pteropus alecto]
MADKPMITGTSRSHLEQITGAVLWNLGKQEFLDRFPVNLFLQNSIGQQKVFFFLTLSSLRWPPQLLNLEAHSCFHRQSDLLVKLNRLLERCLRNSKCIDTESLCVVAGEKVWQIRVDLHLLNHDGNIIDAASIAAIVALCHFRRPDVSVQGDEVTLYTPEERDPVPLSIHHMPICVSFAFFQQGTYLLVDPNEREERVMDGLLVIAMNKHREICTIQSSGGIMLLKDQVLRCSKIAGVKVAEITELIQKALENDQKVRKEGGKFGFAESIANQRITAFKMEKAPVDTSDVEEKAEEIIAEAEPPSEVVSKPVLWTPGTAQIGEGVENSWGDLEDSEREDEDEGGSDEAIILDSIKMDTGLEVSNIGSQDAPIVLSDSEEEEMIILEPDKNPKKIRTQTISAKPEKAPSKKPVKKRKKKRAAN